MPPAAPVESIRQPSLLAAGAPWFDPRLPGLHRSDLGEGAWLDEVPRAVQGAEELFDQVLELAPWQSHERPMYDRMVVEPRLTTRRWSGPPRLLVELAGALSERYGLDLGAVSANLYRDGADSVAWHGDRIGRRSAHTVVAILSLGAPRRFLLRRKAGGPSRRLVPGPGDLLAMGGTAQRTWEHCVPKCRRAGPRISVMFREGY